MRPLSLDVIGRFAKEPEQDATYLSDRFPKDLRFLEILRGVDMKCFEGRFLVIPSPSPDISGSSRCNGNLPALLESLKCPGGIGSNQQKNERVAR